jgi:hypothetical protein
VGASRSICGRKSNIMEVPLMTHVADTVMLLLYIS